MLNAMGYFIDVDPSPQIFVTYSVDMASRLSKHRVAPMLRESESLRGKVKEARSRDSGNTILDKEYDGGQLTLVGANSPAGLAMYPKRVALFDEIERFPLSAGTEGDPVTLALIRTTAYWNAVAVYASSPGIRQISRLWRLWQQSDQNEWFAVCGDCGTEQILKWGQVHWDKDEEGEHQPDTAHYVCEACGSCWNDAQRWAASKRGAYRPQAKFRGIAGFRLGALAVIGRTLRSIVAQWVRAQGSQEELRVFINTVLCEWWDEDQHSRTVDETGLKARREEIPERGGRLVIPAQVAILTAGVDTQDNRFEISVFGWGAGKESWRLAHEVIYGDPTTREGDVLSAAWAALDAWLVHPWHRAAGGIDFIRGICVDTGGHHTQAAYDFCAARYRRLTPDGGSMFTFAIQGAAGSGQLWPASASTTVKKVPLWRIHVDAGKGQLYANLGIGEPGPGYVHFPMQATDEYFKGLTAEKRVEGRDKRGFPTLTWKLRNEGIRNEPLDCAVYADAALHGLRANGFDLEAEVARIRDRPVWEPPEIDHQAEVAPQQLQERRSDPRDESSWLGDTRDWLKR